jgi:hypothetical protein
VSKPNVKPSGRRTRAMEEKVLSLINAERKKRRIPHVVWDEHLHKGASQHSQNMKKKGRLFHAQGTFAECCYGDKSVHISSPYATAEATVKSWMSSKSGHREILLDSKYRHGSVGITTIGGFFATYRCKESFLSANIPHIPIPRTIRDLFRLPAAFHVPKVLRGTLRLPKAFRLPNVLQHRLRKVFH